MSELSGFMQWLGIVVTGGSLMMQFMLQPSIITLVPMLLGVAGLGLSVFGAMVERRQLERQLEQERQEREYRDYVNSPQGQLDIVFDRLRSSMHMPPKGKP